MRLYRFILQPPFPHDDHNADGQVGQREHADHQALQHRGGGGADGQVVVVQRLGADGNGLPLAHQAGQGVHGHVHVGAGGIGVVHILQKDRGAEPDDLAAAVVLNADAHGKGAVDVSVLLVVGGQAVPGRLAEGGVRGGQQLGDGAVFGAAHRQALGDGHQRIIALVDQRIGHVAAGQVGQQHVGRAEGIVLAVLLHHDALGRGDAVVFQQAVQVGQGAVLSGAGADQQLAAAGHVVLQHGHFLVGKIGGGRVDQYAVSLGRDLVHRQKRQGVDLVVFLLQLVREGGGQLGLAVALQHIKLGQVLCDHIVDGRGDGALAVEGGGVGVGVHAALGDVDIVIADIAAAVAGLNDQAVVGDLLVGVLLGEGGVDVGVALGHGDVVGQALVLAQQVFDDVVLLARLHHPVDGHVLLQGVDHHLGVGGDGVQLGGADIVLGQRGGQRGHKQVDHDQQRQHHRRDDQRVGAAQQRHLAVHRRGGAFLFGLFVHTHQLYLLFSSDCTDKNRKNAATER